MKITIDGKLIKLDEVTIENELIATFLKMKNSKERLELFEKSDGNRVYGPARCKTATFLL